MRVTPRLGFLLFRRYARPSRHRPSEPRRPCSGRDVQVGCRACHESGSRVTSTLTSPANLEAQGACRATPPSASRAGGDRQTPVEGHEEIRLGLEGGVTPWTSTSQRSLSLVRPDARGHSAIGTQLEPRLRAQVGDRKTEPSGIRGMVPSRGPDGVCPPSSPTWVCRRASLHVHGDQWLGPSAQGRSQPGADAPARRPWLAPTRWLRPTWRPTGQLVATKEQGTLFAAGKERRRPRPPTNACAARRDARSTTSQHHVVHTDADYRASVVAVGSEATAPTTRRPRQRLHRAHPDALCRPAPTFQPPPPPYEAVRQRGRGPSVPGPAERLGRGGAQEHP